MDLVADERPSDSPFVERVWRAHSDVGGAFISMAEIHCGIVVTKYRGRSILTVRGPETRATPAYFPPGDAEFFGIIFKAGAFMPDLPARMVMDRQDVDLPEATSSSFWLKGSAWQFPDFDNADTFVDWLASDGLLICDPVVDAALHEKPVDYSSRSVQRRFLQATGLTQSHIRQIERARYATALLKQGVSFQDTVYNAGYFDQAHMIRSLKHFIGLTPGQIADKERPEILSFLYNTTPLLLAYNADIQLAAKGELYEDAHGY
jgi:AraC-like DNA-binding protein